MKTYISGPMTGIPDFNFPAFHAVAKKLRDNGVEVVNPAELNPTGTSWGDCMRRDITELMTCHTILMLKGWQKSEGAKLERYIAERLWMGIVYEELVL